MPKHLIVVSVDALVYDDLEQAAAFPHFARILNEGALIKRVRTIYPSLTHPAHASIMTGCHAGTTGVVSNEKFIPGALERPWYNDLSDVQCSTIFHAAHAAGLKTAACSWPVTAKGGDVIDYLVPEIMDADIADCADDPIKAFRKVGTTDNVMDIVESAIKLLGYNNDHPVCDRFEIACAAEIIRRYRPNLLLTHPCYVDNQRHRTGLFSPNVTKALAVTDEWIGMLMDACADAGIADETDIAIVSDHGHLGIVRRMCPNVFLRDRGFIHADDMGNVTSWDAWCASCGLSMQVYLRDPDDKKLYDDVYAALCEMAAEGIYGFGEVLTAEEVDARYSLRGGFSFVIETDGYTSFSDDCVRPAVRQLSSGPVRAGSMAYRFGHSTHGHMPEKGPQPTFLAMGPSFRRGAVIETGEITDHAPTFARVLGIELPEAEGRAAVEILA